MLNFTKPSVDDDILFHNIRRTQIPRLSNFLLDSRNFFDHNIKRLKGLKGFIKTKNSF